MGWLCQDHKLHGETPAQHISRELTYTGTTHRAAVLGAATVRNTIYAAVHITDRESGQNYTLCAVVPFQNHSRYGFGYKEMTERRGPWEVDCPARIMRMLSPIAEIPDASCAADWRARVAAATTARKAARRFFTNLAPGDRIRLSAPAHFGKYSISADTFLVIAIHKRTPIFAPVAHPAFRCRLHRQALQEAVVER